MAAPGSLDPAFDRDMFLMRQQVMRISSKYDVTDEAGNKILFIERPAHLLRGIAAIFAAILAFFVSVLLVVWIADMIPDENISAIVTIIGMIGAFGAAMAAGVAISAKRHITFYRDQRKQERLLEIIQDAKFQLITMTFTVRDPEGRTIALLWKNVLFNIIRKRWYVKAPDGTVMYLAKEDSVILSLLRRVLGPMLGLLRTNFIFVRPDNDDVLGEFNRKLTILDRYSLDMRGDPERRMDRRVAIALGVMLDTGERR
jgi:uncharacterized protein YxjI